MPAKPQTTHFVFNKHFLPSIHHHFAGSSISPHPSLGHEHAGLALPLDRVTHPWLRHSFAQGMRLASLPLTLPWPISMYGCVQGWKRSAGIGMRGLEVVSEKDE
jgi:hypothetical protein